MWHGSSRSGVATLRTAIHLLLTYLRRGVTNNIVYRVFGAMSKDLCGEICVHFGIDSVENLVASRQNCFINRHGEADKYL